MNETSFIALSAWLTQEGLAGTSESHIVSGFCDRCVAAGLPLDRAHLFIDTLHPVHEGRLFRWGHSPDKSALLVRKGHSRPGRTMIGTFSGARTKILWRLCCERWVSRITLLAAIVGAVAAIVAAVEGWPK